MAYPRLSVDFPTTLDRDFAKQIPFAMARALTQTAQKGQEAVLAGLKRNQKIVLRNNFVEQGFRVDPAKKNDLIATVFARTSGPFNIDFMVRQETGGVKRPTRGNRHVSLPGKDTKRNDKDIVTKGKRPRAVRNKPNVFVLDERSSISARRRAGRTLLPGIYQRSGAKNQRARAKGLKTLFIFKQATSVPVAFHFRSDATKAMLDALPDLFEQSLADAWVNAK